MDRARPGATLVELLVVLVVLAVGAGLAGIAIRADADRSAPGAIELIAGARARAVRAGQPIFVTVASGADSADSAVALVRPDGSVIGAPSGLIDPTSGRPADAAR
jgi:prepilin-type N-terminal cleavage/methylation domain-containing protein